MAANAALAVAPEEARSLLLTLVRHGITTWNAEGRLQGQTDIPLSSEGYAQAEALRSRFADGFFSAAYASDLERARETARIAVHDRLAVTTLPELRERSFGKFEGLTSGEARERYGAETHHNAGESYTEVDDRMMRALQRLWNDYAQTDASPPRTILVAGHGGSLRLLLCRAVGIGPEGAQHFHLDNTGVSVVEFRGTSAADCRGRLFLLNDTSHLRFNALQVR